MKKIFDKIYSSIERYFSIEYGTDVGSESFFSAMKCYDNEEYEKALALYRIALKHEPDSDATYNNMGNVYLAQKEYDQALIHYKQALLLNPQSLNVTRHIAWVYHEQENYKEALSYYLESLKVDTDTNIEESYINIGYCYYYLKNYEEAIEFYKKALKYEYKKEYLTDLSYVYYLTNQYEEAKISFDKVLTLDSKDEYALYMLGILFWKEKNYKKSLHLLLELLKINKNHKDALSYIPLNLFKLNQLEKSIEYGLKLLEAETDKPTYYCNLFEAELILNRPFTEKLEIQFIEKFKDDKQSFILYSHLKILKDIFLQKEVDLDKWKTTYVEISFNDWEFIALEKWARGQEDGEVKEKILEALDCFQEKINDSLI